MTMQSNSTLLSWPGKSPAEPGGVFHPAVYHMLDVGAVLNLLLARAGFERPLHEALCALGVLHDVGKISNSFRDMIESGATQEFRHWRISMEWFRHFDEALLGPALGSESYIRDCLYFSSAGHHGGPPEDNGPRMRRRLIQIAGSAAEQDVRSLIETVLELFPEASLASLNETFEESGGSWRTSARTLSWWYAGLVSVSDWIGSNVSWFPPVEPTLSVDEYWREAGNKAEDALAECGLSSASPSSVAVQSLFPFDRYTPMQNAVLDVALPEGQSLAILEDATGSGKTEAALLLAQRMLQAGKGDGIFFALPTMATANAMFGRLESMRKMFDGTPSLALAHGRARFHEGFQSIIGAERDEPDLQMSCSNWFADGRRKALLAQIGVGTIDQALLGVLPTRYNALRLYALSRKVLIVDEAHDYDDYMQQELEALMTFQAMLGGSVILMTATLPQGMRKRLISAFQEGRLSESFSATGSHYPQLTVLGGSAEVIQVDPVDETSRVVQVSRIDSLESAIDLLLSSVNEGAACAFVRNSVNEAIEAVFALRARGCECILHHARFALCDRLANEQRVLDLLGKGVARKQGFVVVGTQVLEHSLDIDFDVMVSDLAPVGALIQRAGRLWRHERPARPVPGPVLHVLSPDPMGEVAAEWGKALLGDGWYVYETADLWCTAKALSDAGQIRSPSKASEGNVRALVEFVERRDEAELPAALDAAAMQDEGNRLSDRAFAQLNLLDANADYASAQAVFSDEEFPTRLATPQVTLRLARRSDAGLVPWYEGHDDSHSWGLSEVSISRKAWERAKPVDQELAEIRELKRDMADWEKMKYQIVPIESSGMVADSLLRYDTGLGLVLSSQAQE
ncbi:MAG: CRISPR-associated helicase/endonuclease Cas3 [Gammaproteobacteria bacterium]|nr:MAG: CRISPR-associated helicase/endonuclease Cas3 [Gammaproteobacteria bacterium]